LTVLSGIAGCRALLLGVQVKVALGCR